VKAFFMKHCSWSCSWSWSLRQLQDEVEVEVERVDTKMLFQ